MILNELRS